MTALMIPRNRLGVLTGSSAQQVLPFTGLGQAEALAVDSVGNVYVSDWGDHGEKPRAVVKLPVR